MLAKAATVYSANFLEALRPDPILTVSEWADRHRELSPKSSSEPGKWRTSRTPYLKEIMDSLSPESRVERVVFKKGSQIGGSECGFNWIGYVIDSAPGPMLMVQPTVGMAERNSKQRIDPMITDSLRLSAKVNQKKAKSSGNTILSKEFTGGILVMGGANSAASLSNMPAKYLFLDEVDRYPGDVEGEGDPVGLAMARTRTFARKKIFLCSTPTEEGLSRIDQEFELSDKRFFNVPCPHCSVFQALRWDRLKWPESEPHKAYYQCEHCDSPIEEHNKTAMLAAGKWIATNPGGQGKIAGFHLSALYSPIGWFSWGQIASLYEESKDIPEKLKVFVNTILGDVYKSKGDAPDWKRIYDRRETYQIGRVPMGAVLLTAGVDVQKDRLECEVVGWGPGLESWSVIHIVFPGDIQTQAPWEALDLFLLEQFEHESGSRIPISKIAIDSGAYTQKVYNWARRYPMTRVIAVKGFESQPLILGRPSPVDINVRGQTVRRGYKIWPVGTNASKSELYGLLKLEKPLDGELFPPGYCHFPEYAPEYFKQLTAEQVVTKKVRGYVKLAWEKTRERNEALDLRVYARMAAAALGIDRMQSTHWLAYANRIGAKIDFTKLKNAPESSGKNQKEPQKS